MLPLKVYLYTFTINAGTPHSSYLDKLTVALCLVLSGDLPNRAALNLTTRYLALHSMVRNFCPYICERFSCSFLSLSMLAGRVGRGLKGKNLLQWEYIFFLKIILHFRRTFFKQEVRKVVSPFKNSGKTWRGTHTPDEDKHHRQDFFIAQKIRKHYFPRIFTLR